MFYKNLILLFFFTLNFNVEAQIPGTWNSSPQTTTSNAIGIGTIMPVGWQEIEMKSTTPWSDYVFDSTYVSALQPIEQLRDSVFKNKRLSNMPSAIEVENNGVKQMEFNVKFLENVEQLYLYVIKLNEEIKYLKAKLGDVEKND